MLLYIENKKASNAPTLLLMHGYGSQAREIGQIVEFLAIDSMNTLLVQAPIALPYEESYAWFPIEFPDDHTTIQLDEQHPEGLEEAAAQVITLIDHLGISPSQLFLGGFSQGAIMSVQVALQMQERPAGLLLFSGTLVNGRAWEKEAPQKAGVPFFQSHGTEDPLLSFQDARKLFRLLQSAGWKGEFASFRGGHTIPLPILTRVRDFLLTTSQGS